MYNPTELVRRIDSLLDKAGKKRKDLCLYCGISTQAITNWSKRGSIPAIDTIMKAAEVLHVSVEYLVTGAEPGKPDTAPIIAHLEAALDDLKRW